jgi:hypothetical protein
LTRGILLPIPACRITLFLSVFFAISASRNSLGTKAALSLPARKKRQLFVVWILLFDADLIAAGGGVGPMHGASAPIRGRLKITSRTAAG